MNDIIRKIDAGEIEEVKKLDKIIIKSDLIDSMISPKRKTYKPKNSIDNNNSRSQIETSLPAQKSN